MTYKEMREIISEIAYVVFLTLLVLFGLHMI
jgi:hypothetical protein